MCDIEQLKECENRVVDIASDNLLCVHLRVEDMSGVMYYYCMRGECKNDEEDL